MSALQIVWLRRDLRLADQAALTAAAAAGPVIPVYVLDDEAAGARKLGAASRWWLHGSLEALGIALHKLGSRLILRRGRAAEVLAELASELGADVHALRHYEPWWREAEDELGHRVRLHLYDGNYLLPPGELRSGSGRPYRIFTPFHLAATAHLSPSEPLPIPTLNDPGDWPSSDELADWKLRPSRPDWATGLRSAWAPGEVSALAAVATFLDRAGRYETDRNRPSVAGSSRLSPHLHWGEISPATVWHALADCRGEGPASFRRELIWRDFAQNLVAQFPGYGEQSHRPEYAKMPWRNPDTDADAAHDLAAWRQGRTGYPILDAGMRQLWASGWMHNRVRMIAASFLVKHLLIDWRHGERWFWDTLVDADYANNAVNWQWIAGSGVDASLWSRIMAPLTQSAKFAAGDYIREWVPELSSLSDAEVHDPPRRPNGYPEPAIGHREARERALAAYRAAKS